MYLDCAVIETVALRDLLLCFMNAVLDVARTEIPRRSIPSRCWPLLPVSFVL